MKKQIFALIFIALTTIISCKKSDDSNNNNSSTSTVTDIDGNVYKTHSIGGQIWMTESLRTTHYRNGDPVTFAPTDGQWSSMTEGAYCCYENDTNNQSVYGNLYNWLTVNDSRNIAPVGWHIPTKEEYDNLIDFLNNGFLAGGALKEAGVVHWKSPNDGATNSSGFTALPGGIRYSDGIYDNITEIGGFWTSTLEASSQLPLFLQLINTGTIAPKLAIPQQDGCSIRCVKD